MSSPVSSKMQAASFSMSQSKQRPTAGFAVMPLVPSEPPQTVPTIELVERHGHRGLLLELRAHLLHDLESRVQRARGAAGLLDHEQIDGPAAGVNRAAQLLAIEALAAERHEQHGADIRMRAQPLHHLERVLVRVAAGETDQVHVIGARLLDDEPRDVMRALDQVGDRDDIADALAAVLAKKSSS